MFVYYCITICMTIFLVKTTNRRKLDYTSTTYPSIDDYSSCYGSATNNFICDPDQILNSTARSNLDYKSKQMYSKILESTRCSDIGIKVGIVLLRKLSYTGDKNAAMKDFCIKQLEKWTLAKSGNCENAIMICLSIQDRYIYIYSLPISQKYICMITIGEIITAMQKHTKSDDWYSALIVSQNQIAARYNIIICPESPEKISIGKAVAIVIISLLSGIVISILFLLLLWFILKKKTPLKTIKKGRYKLLISEVGIEVGCGGCSGFDGFIRDRGYEGGCGGSD